MFFNTSETKFVLLYNEQQIRIYIANVNDMFMRQL